MKHAFIVLSVVAVLLIAACGGADDQSETAVGGQPAAGGDVAEESPGADQSQDSESAVVEADAGQSSTGDAQAFSSVSAIGMDLQWRVEDDEVEVRVSGPTTGWVAVGFDAGFGMQNANILIGYVRGDEVVVTDQFGVTTVTHQLDSEIGGSRDVRLLGGSEVDGVTQLHFRIPLDSGDSRDRPLVPGQEYRVILAYGEPEADDVISYHQNRGAVSITL